MSEQRHDGFIETVRQQLDAQTDGLDELTVARWRALAAQRDDGRRWRPAFGVATAAAALLALLLWQSPGAPPLPAENWEITLSGDDLDLIEQYGFHEWLDTTQAAG